jgi:hypothetical protein
VEQAEEGFVDDEENLEEGEICLKSWKAFAAREDDSEEKVFLCAGALIQRPRREGREDEFSSICDAWMADSTLEECGPNLQLKGAVQILDELFLFHLGRELGVAELTDEDLLEASAVQALRNFVLHCGESESEYTCASYMASQLRGFISLKEAVRRTSIYNSQYYDNDLDGMVFDYESGLKVYENAGTSSEIADMIIALLPDAETVKWFATKRFTIQGAD